MINAVERDASNGGKENETMEPAAKRQPVRAALIGTGYIADFHARAIRTFPGVEIDSVCDSNIEAARSFAQKWAIGSYYDSPETMLRERQLDAVHILTPPDSHLSLALTVLRARANVLIEKPMCISVSEASEILSLADEKQLCVGVSHNMLYARPYQRLRQLVQAGRLGALQHVSINHFVELKQIRLGPFGAWMLNAPGNVFLEIGPHLVSALIDLVGRPNEISAVADRAVIIPGRKKVFRRWRILSQVGHTAAEINVDLGPGFPQRTIYVRGTVGSVTVDFDADTCTLDRRTSMGTDFDRFVRNRLISRQIRSQARRTIVDYAFSKIGSRNRGNPYQVTFLNGIADFYGCLTNIKPLDFRIAGATGRDVVELCTSIIQNAGVELESLPRSKPQVSPRSINPTVLVIGGSGFIGRKLIERLLDTGFNVRAVVRGAGETLQELPRDRVEIVRANIYSQGDIERALRGIDYVYYLVHSNPQTWEENVRQNIEPARMIAEACLCAGVKRLIYTSTIDAYYAGRKAGVITEQTSLDRRIARRNYYARAKAAIEAILIELHRTKGLPIVILRPGIVIGDGGNPFHFGVAMGQYNKKQSSVSFYFYAGDFADAIRRYEQGIQQIYQTHNEVAALIKDLLKAGHSVNIYSFVTPQHGEARPHD